MKKLAVTLCGMIVLTGLSSQVFAEGANCPPKNWQNENMDHQRQFPPEMKAKMEQKRAEFEQRLNLTPEQKEKMKAIHEASKEKMRPLFESIRAEKQQMKALGGTNASAENIQAEQAKLMDIKSRIRAIRKSNFEQVQAILTPEQQKEFNKMHEEHKKMFEQRKHQFGGKENKTGGFEEKQ